MTDTAQSLTRVMLSLFRVHGELLAAGDRLVEPVGLTSARWQVLGALARGPLTVSQIARVMGMSRQGVQRTADQLERDTFLNFAPNPAHAKSDLLKLTSKGEAALRRATERQIAWSRKLARDFKDTELV